MLFSNRKCNLIPANMIIQSEKDFFYTNKKAIDKYNKQICNLLDAHWFNWLIVVCIFALFIILRIRYNSKHKHKHKYKSS